MARELINIGTIPNDHTGENLLLVGQKLNRMTGDLYSVAGLYHATIHGGAVGDGVANDYTALMNGFAAAQAAGLGFYMPDTYNIGSNTLQFGGGPNGQVYLFGKPGKTLITSTSATANILQIGNGTAPAGTLCHGVVHGIHLQGPNSSPAQNGQIGLLLNAMLHVRVSKCEVRNCDIGYRMINNCYGANFTECRAGFGGTCNVGADNCSTPNAGCGNQILYDNCWIYGAIAGYHISGGADGINIRNGQCGSAAGGLGADFNAGVIWGKDYLTQTTGNSGIILVDGVDFEGMSGWVARGYGECALTIRNCPMISYNNGTTGVMAQGIVKATTGGNLSVALLGNTVRGYFASAVAVTLSGYGGGTYVEFGSRTDGAFFAGTASGQSLLASSRAPTGLALYHDYTFGDVIYFGATMLRAVSGTLQTSTDFGVSWSGPIDPSTLANKGSFLDAQTIQGSLDGTALSTIADSIGAGNAFTQATGSFQPLYRNLYSSVRLPNARPVITFDGSNDFLSNADSASVAQTVFVVAKLNTTAPSAQAIVGASGNGGFVLRVEANNYIVMEADGVALIARVGASLDATRYHVFVGSFSNPGAWSIFYDGVKLGSGTIATTLTASLTRVVGRQNGGNYFSGQIAAVYPFTTVLPDSTIAGVSAFLKQQFGTP